jgi:hypothetical protein
VARWGAQAVVAPPRIGGQAATGGTGEMSHRMRRRSKEDARAQILVRNSAAHGEPVAC